MNRTTINWDTVKARIAEGERALDKSIDGDPEYTQAVYHRRALQLANRQLRSNEEPGSEPTLLFTIRTESCGVRLADVAEILPFTGCTPVPGAATELLGVINLRGEIRPVADLGRILGMPESPAANSGYVLVITSQDRHVGLRVDGVQGIRLLSAADRKHLTDAESVLPARFVKGWTNDLLILLNTPEILNHIFHQEA